MHVSKEYKITTTKELNRVTGLINIITLKETPTQIHFIDYDPGSQHYFQRHHIISIALRLFPSVKTAEEASLCYFGVCKRAAKVCYHPVNEHKSRAHCRLNEATSKCSPSQYTMLCNFLATSDPAK